MKSTNKTETITVRVRAPLKRKAKALFGRLGLTTSQSISLFLAKSVEENGLPFSVNLPNAETRGALKAEKEGRGLKRHPDADALYSELGL